MSHVWVSTVNGYISGVYGSEDLARSACDAFRASCRTETWRPVGDRFWASERYTSVGIKPFPVYHGAEATA